MPVIAHHFTPESWNAVGTLESDTSVMNSRQPDKSGSSEKRALAVLATLAVVVIVIATGVLKFISFMKNPHMDVGIYYEASLALRTGGDMFGAFHQAPLTYIYPPFFAILFMPFTFLSPEGAGVAWTVVNIILLLACLWLGGRELIRRFDASLDSATLPVLMLLSIICFYPRVDAEFDQGQVDFLVLAGIIWSLMLVRRHPMLAGVLLGIVANVKYQTVIFVPYFLLRGWWSSAVGFVAGMLAAALSGALVIGWAANLNYLHRAFSGLGTMMGLPPGDGNPPFILPVEWSESISLTSTFARWSASSGLGEQGMFMMVGVAAIACALLGWFIHHRVGVPLFRGRFGVVGRTSDRVQPLVLLEWLGLMVAAISFAPQTKMRHLALLLLLAMMGVLLLIVQRQGVPRLPLLVVMVVVLLIMMLPPPMTEELHDLRKFLRSQGLPIWGLLALYFTILWTGLKWVRSMDGIDGENRSSALDKPVDEVA